MKKLILTAVFALAGFAVFAQGVITFDKTEHDFGDVKEGDQATYSFSFTNTGKAPIVITQVSATCGCTTPEWTKEPVMAGKKGFIKAIYNSAGRPGAFAKQISVTSNATVSMVTLNIKGMVNAAPATAHGDGDGHDHGKPKGMPAASIGFEEPVFVYGKTQRGQNITKEFTFLNSGTSDLIVEKVSSACNCVTMLSKPTIVKPGKTGVLKLAYKPLAITKNPENITVYSNDKTGSTATIILQGEVVESLTESNMLRQQDKSVPFK